MSLSASPAIKRVESSTGIPVGAFAEKNYHSVFDIVRQSRKQFITANASWLGARSGKVWDLAMGQAQYIRRLFRENRLTRGVRQGLPRTISGQPARRKGALGGIQGLVQDGPDWQNQFGENWQAYCQSGAPEACDSPVSYLTWLYGQALSFEREMEAVGGVIIPLSERRPDLASMTIDNDAVSQVIPALQLVNEILEGTIATGITSGSVDKTLASTRYPTLLPYHFPHDQTELSLQNAGVPLEDIIGQTSTDWPWFLQASLTGTNSNNATELASRLAPEQQTIITEPTQTDWSTFYSTNLGSTTTDYMPFEEMDTFTYQLGITVTQTEQLLANTAGGTTVVVSENVESTDYPVGSEYYGASFINASTAPAVQLTFLVSATVTDLGTNVSNGGTLELSATGNSPCHSKGLFSDGVCFYNTADSYGYLTGNAKATLDPGGSFSVAFWIKISDTPPADIPIFSNNLNDKTQPGFSLLFTPENIITLGVSDNSGNNYFSYSSATTIDTGVWYFVCLSWSGTSKLAYIYYSPQHGSVSTITADCSSATGTFPVADGMEWTFNNYGDFSYYSDSLDGDGHVSVIIDDISLYYHEELTEEQAQTIVTKQSIAVDAGLALSVQHEFIFSNNDYPLLLNLSNDRMDRINRMVRLQRWLGLSYEEIDLLLSACIVAQGTDNADYTLNNHTLRALGVFRHWQQKYNITAFQFAAVLSQITPYVISPSVPFLDQVFNSPSLFDTPFTITGNTVSYGDSATPDDIQVISQLCAGLNLTRAQFMVLAKYVATAQGSAASQTFPLTLDTVSAFYRLALIPRWLGLSFAEGASLFSLLEASDGVWTTLASIPQLATLNSSNQPDGGDILDALMALDAATDWSKDNNMSWVKNYLDLHTSPDTLIASTGTVNFVNGIVQQLPSAVLSDASFAGVPEPLNTAFSCPNGYDTTTGIVNNGAVLLDSSLSPRQYGVFSENANTLANGSNNYTLGMWLYLPSGTSTGETAVIAANGDWEKQGVFISVADSTNLYVSIYDSTSACKTDKTLDWTADTWFYLALTFDASTRTLTGYTVKQDGTVATPVIVDFSSLTGSVETVAGNAWHLNEDGPGTFYQQWPKSNKISYDDVTVWNTVLTQEQITSIVEARVPASQTVPTGTTETAFTDWISTLSDLVDSSGLVLPAAADYDTIHDAIQNDMSGMFFASDVDTAQVTDSLAGIIFQAMLTQYGIADSALSQLFSTQQALSPFLLQWAGDSEYRLLSDSLTLSGGDSVTDPAVITTDYLTHLYTLGQRADITTRFSLTPLAVSTFLAYPGWLKSGLNDLTPTLILFWLFSCYDSWLHQSIKEDAVLAYLTWVNAGTTQDATKAAQALALLLDADSDEVTLAVAELTGGIAKTVADVGYVMRLLSLSAQTGLSITPLLETGALVPGDVDSTWDAWQTVGNALVAAQTGN